MAKDNLFLGTARGSVGDVTFSRLNGVQIARVRNRSPRNPQSPAQMVQRIIMSTVGKAYAFMSSICNHSFEGFEGSGMSQRKFMEANIAMMRDKCADVLAYPVEEQILASTAYNFSFKADYAPVLNSYIISDGSLPAINLIATPTGYDAIIPMTIESESPATMSYEEVITRLGIQRGDQLTFIQVTHNGSYTDHAADVITGFRYARVIMEPADGDMNSRFLGVDTIANPNPRNEGSFRAIYYSVAEGKEGISFRLSDVSNAGSTADSDKTLCASAVILSRQVGSKWLRSRAVLLPSITSGATALNHSTLGLAYDTYRLGANSDLYLNQAE